MRRLRIVPSRLDPLVCEKPRELLPVRTPNNVEVPRRIASLWLLWQPEAHRLQFCESIGVEARGGAALSVPLLEQRKLLEQDDRLDGVQPGGIADIIVAVLAGLSVDAKCSRMLGQRRIVGHECARVPYRPEVLRGVEAEGRRCGGVANGHAVAAGPVSLTGVLDDCHAVTLCDARKSAHVCHLSVKVNGQHVRRSVCGGTLCLSNGQVVVVLGDVDDYGSRLCLNYRLECRRESHRGDHDSGLWSETRRDQR